MAALPISVLTGSKIVLLLLFCFHVEKLLLPKLPIVQVVKTLDTEIKTIGIL